MQALQENSSPSKMYLVNPPCVFISRRKRGLLCMQVLNGIRLLQVSVSPLFSSQAGPGELSNTAHGCHGFQHSTASRIPDRYFTTVVLPATQNSQSPLSKKYTQPQEGKTLGLRVGTKPFDVSILADAWLIYNVGLNDKLIWLTICRQLCPPTHDR